MTWLRRLGIMLALLSLNQIPAQAAQPRILVDPTTILNTAERMDFVGRNDFAVVRETAGTFLRSTPQKSASGLYVNLHLDGRSLGDIRWTWRVDAIQRSSDLRKLGLEDSAATIFFIFGKPSMFNRDVPTLAYVWSGTPVAKGTVFPSARYTSLRYINLEGVAAVGSWKSEVRNVSQDFRDIFHREPDTLRYIAVFNDNDQTGEACSAFFGPITLGR